jgi:uncharacterized protein (TIGR03545 family)
MKNIIRWQGLLYFAFLAVLLCLFTFFFIDNFIARQIEKMGSALVGAKVELEKADLTFFPAGLELSRLRITNPDSPMRNAVEIDRIAMTINSLRLLEKKIIIEEMAAEGIRPDTPRRKSGAIPKYTAEKPAAPPEKGGLKLPDLRIPDVKEVLAGEKLASVELVAEYREQAAAESARWQQRLAELPDEEKLNSYQERLEKLKGAKGIGGLLGGAKELITLRGEIQADLERLRAAREDFKQTSESYRARLTELQNAPQRDIERLAAKYTPSAEGLANLSSLVFGPKTGTITRRALAWYKRVQPLLARSAAKKDGGAEVVKPVRGKGVWVRFEESAPLPDFLIRRIAASIKIEAGNFDGTINNLTPDQDILGIPLSFDFAGDSLQDLRAISFDGVLNHVAPAQPRDTINLAIRGYSIRKTELSDNETLPVALDSGLADLNGEAILKGTAINADFRAQLTSANFTVASAESLGAIPRTLAEALTSIKNVSARAEIEGTVEDYRLRINSDLDKVLKNAVSRSIEQKTAEFKRDLQEKVMAQVKDPLAAAEGDFARFGNISEEISARLQTATDLLK